MRKSTSLFFLSVFCFLSAFAQSDTEAFKECRIACGIGIGGATNNSRSAGRDVWLQLDYKMNKNISVAMEFDNMAYTLQGQVPDMPEDLNQTNVAADNFSLLLKYHIETKLPLKLAVGSGWTYSLKTSQYWYYENPGSRQYLSQSVSIAEDYEFPLLLDAEYPLWKPINVRARVRYNLAAYKGSTYSAGIGLSLKL